MTRSWRMLCVLLAVLVLAWGGGADAAERWWRVAAPEVLFAEDCADGELSGWGR